MGQRLPNRHKLTNGANEAAFPPLGTHLTNGHVWPLPVCRAQGVCGAKLTSLPGENTVISWAAPAH
jgi:hypothetical protein